MLEELAFKYLNLSDQDLRGLGYALVIAGGLAAGMLNRSRGQLQRTPYFAFSALLFLASAVTQVPWWFGFLPAMDRGFLWTLMASDIVGSVVIGYFYGVIAMARSRDAYGHGRWAALAFIPFANLVLLGKPSKDAVSGYRIPTLPMFTGGAGVMSGLAMLIAGVALTAAVRAHVQGAVERIATEPELQAINLEFMLRGQGLEATLAQIAAEVSVPQKIDEATVLSQVTADAAVIRYFYQVDEARARVDRLTETFKRSLAESLCSNLATRRLLTAGGTIEQSYRRIDGRGIGTLAVTRESCAD